MFPLPKHALEAHVLGDLECRDDPPLDLLVRCPVVSDVRRFRSEEARREELSKETRAERAHRKAQIKRDSLQPF